MPLRSCAYWVTSMTHNLSSDIQLNGINIDSFHIVVGLSFLKSTFFLTCTLLLQRRLLCGGPFKQVQPKNHMSGDVFVISFTTLSLFHLDELECIVPFQHCEVHT